ncbi:hypothetical protein [Amycolatopsis sp. FDAARGOS 1241]|uniref:hypothetical protein n=1 Tax=Amycolatopsis sp. FDAARGOS 1241 TaxID=2778070 RepID=UPI00194FAC99|nr:hypothetical protein [Amycolatopsis sp. FDAARGOS 1241]QRP48677.1 hypothetical protein I6J71_13130 [Amycolatopsis sp. FDAARGOS 1241]
MKAARFAAATAAAALVALACTACDGHGSAAPADGGPQATSELNGIQSTLDSIESDMAGDGSP